VSSFTAPFVRSKEGVSEILGRQLVAVVEQDVIAKLDLHGQPVLRKIPALDQVRNELELGILIQRLIEERLEDGLSIRREALIGIPGRDVAWPSHGGGIIRRKSPTQACGCARGCRCARCHHLQQGPPFELECHDLLLVVLCWISPQCCVTNCAALSLRRGRFQTRLLHESLKRDYMCGVCDHDRSMEPGRRYPALRRSRSH
jgi:hypothetical protein